MSNPTPSRDEMIAERIALGSWRARYDADDPEVDARIAELDAELTR